jgi:hypothetical protein
MDHRPGLARRGRYWQVRAPPPSGAVHLSVPVHVPNPPPPPQHAWPEPPQAVQVPPIPIVAPVHMPPV